MREQPEREGSEKESLDLQWMRKKGLGEILKERLGGSGGSSGRGSGEGSAWGMELLLIPCKVLKKKKKKETEKC